MSMMSGGKRAPSPRGARRALPDAERRLRASFPEVWAWYELLVAARGVGTADRSARESIELVARTCARR
jgi:hypothetical protein